MTLTPLVGAPGHLLGVSVSFVDVTRDRRVRDELAHANTELERAYEELQSTNEELETTNEELQSTNDELQVINEELRGRTEELDQANTFLGSVLRSLGNAVIVLTEDLRVRVWSPGAEDLWGLWPEEAESKELLSLDIGLPAAEVESLLLEVFGAAGENGAAAPSARRVTAVNRRGKTVGLRLTATPMRAEEDEVSGLILVIDQEGP